MKRRPCFECGEPSEYDHHVVPYSKGGTQTVRLCIVCHGKAHDVTLRNLTRAAMQKLQAQGLYTGGLVKFGFKVGKGGKLIKNSKERAIMAIAAECHAEGMGLRAIARYLNGAGYRSRADNEFQATQVIVMVKQWKNIQRGVCAEGKQALMKGIHNNNEAEQYQRLRAEKRKPQLQLPMTDNPASE